MKRLEEINRRKFLELGSGLATGLAGMSLAETAYSATEKSVSIKNPHVKKPIRSIKENQSPTGIFVVAPSTSQVDLPFFINVKLLTHLFEVELDCFTTHYPTVTSSTSFSPRALVRKGDGFHFRSDIPSVWKGKLKITSDESYIGPKEIVFDERSGPYAHDKRPIQKAGPIRFSKPGVHFITLEDPATGLRQESNPVSVSHQPLSEELYWGDIHGHTIFTDGVRTPEEYYYFARDEAFLDICALTEHVEYYLTDYMWDYFTAVTNGFHEPNRFVTLIAQEWTNMELGHRNLYYAKDSAPFIRATDVHTSTLSYLYKFARENGALVVPHHSATKLMGCDWSLGHDPQIERLVEVYSSWGSSERPLGPGHSRTINGGEKMGSHVVDALKLGRKFGMLASGDTHDGRPGHCLHRHKFGQTGGLVGVWARELTRESVFDALWNRRVFGTTGPRIYLQFSMDGSPMGSEISYKETTPIIINAVSEVPIASITLVKNGQDHKHLKPNLREVHWTFDARSMEPASYYVRVTREDDEMAWSSPIWVEA